MVDHSRSVYVNAKAAESVRRDVLKALALPDSDKHTKTVLASLIGDYLRHRGIEPEGLVRDYLGVVPRRLALPQLDYRSIGYVIDHVLQRQLAAEKDGMHSKRKTHGAYYTPFPVADFIVRRTLENPQPGSSLLDPACGTGVFLCAAAQLLSENGWPNRAIIASLHGWDKNSDALAVAQLLIGAELRFSPAEWRAFKAGAQFVCQDSLLALSQARYDYLVANPPYDRLKPDRLKARDKAAMQLYIAQIRDSGQFPLSQSGPPELSRLFVEKMHTLAEKQAGFIVPMSFANDKSASGLRAHLLREHKLKTLVFVPEKAKLFEGVSQAFCIAILGRSADRLQTATCNDGDLRRLRFNATSPTRVLSAFPRELNLADMPDASYRLVAHLNAFPTIKDTGSLRNRRGEMDLTLHKDLLGRGQPKLLRGRHVAEWAVSGCERVDYTQFCRRMAGTPRAEDMKHARIACQQITNMDAKKRLKWALVQPGMILGNSLNYIALTSPSPDLLWGLLAVMNSLLMDWRFRITSSNNHVNNYELDALPLPRDLASLAPLGQFVRDNQARLHDADFRYMLEQRVLALYEAQAFTDLLAAGHPQGALLTEPVYAKAAYA